MGVFLLVVYAAYARTRTHGKEMAENSGTSGTSGTTPDFAGVSDVPLLHLMGHEWDEWRRF